MHEDKNRADSVTPSKEDAERDATSSETVGDLDESAATTTSANQSSDKVGNSSAPSPDGQFDSPREGTGPGEESGPM